MNTKPKPHQDSKPNQINSISIMTTQVILDGQGRDLSIKPTTYDGYLKKFDKYKQQSTFIDYEIDEETSSLTDDQLEDIKSKKQYYTRIYGVFDLFLENIPTDYAKQLPLKYSIYFGICAYSLSLLTLIYFAVSGYIQISKQQFISLDSTAGDCTDVLKPLSNSYYATYSGTWEGMQNNIDICVCIKLSFEQEILRSVIVIQCIVLSFII